MLLEIDKETANMAIKAVENVATTYFKNNTEKLEDTADFIKTYVETLISATLPLAGISPARGENPETNNPFKRMTDMPFDCKEDIIEALKEHNPDSPLIHIFNDIPEENFHIEHINLNTDEESLDDLIDTDILENTPEPTTTEEE